jgi:hypothetical protein
MICPFNLLRHGIVNMVDAAMLECCGRAGILGVTTVQAASACRVPHNTAHGSLLRLRELDLVMPPTRDTGQGRVNRHVISPKGLSLLQAAPIGGFKPAVQLPINLS